MKGKLYAIGAGPGDPELITLKGLRLLKEVDLILSTRNDQEEESAAISIIRPLLELPEDRYMEFIFPVKNRCQVFMDLWLQAAKKIYRLVEEGKKIAFIVPGDPVIYTIFVYLLDIIEEEYGKIPLEIVPGISSFSAGASSINIPLVMDSEKLAVVPPTISSHELTSTLNNFDTVAIINAGSKAWDIFSLLKENNLVEQSYILKYCRDNNKYVEVIADSIEKETADISLFVIKNY